MIIANEKVVYVPARRIFVLYEIANVVCRCTFHFVRHMNSAAGKKGDKKSVVKNECQSFFGVYFLWPLCLGTTFRTVSFSACHLFVCSCAVLYVWWMYVDYRTVHTRTCYMHNVLHSRVYIRFMGLLFEPIWNESLLLRNCGFALC